MRNILRNAVLATAILATGSAARAVVLINELDCDQSVNPDGEEFVELYNTGPGSVDLGAGQYVLVLWNGSNDQTYASPAVSAYNLTGTIAAGGYYVIGNVPGAAINFAAATDALQNGQDAVGLYSGTTAASFPAGTSVTATGLVDAVVYDTADADDPVLIATLTPGQPQIDETTTHPRSIQRVPDGAGGALNTSSMSSQVPTPGAANVASTTPALTVNVASVSFGRFNAINTGSPATRTVRLTNSGGGTLNVTTLGIQSGSNAVFAAGTPAPTIPAALGAGQFVELIVNYENSVNATATFAGNVEYVTDAPVSGSGTVPISADYVQILQTASAGAVVINELAYDPAPPSPAAIQDYNGDGTGSATDDEFLELHNTTASPINIQGWAINKTLPSVGQFIFPVGTTLPANGHVVVFGGGTPTGFSNAVVGNFGGLTNAGAEVQITDGTTVHDIVAFGNQEGSMSPGGEAAGVTSDGGSIGRATDGSLTWAAFAFDGATPDVKPSPGAANGVSPAGVGSWATY